MIPRIKLIELFGVITFAASCLAAVNDIHLSAVGMSLVILLIIYSGDSAAENRRQPQHYFAFLICPIIALMIWKMDFIEASVWIGLALLAYSTFLAFLEWRMHNQLEINALVFVAWAVVFIDGNPEIFGVRSLILQTILSVIGLWSGVVIGSWTRDRLGVCFCGFWTVQMALVLENSTADFYGIGWLQRWIS